MSNITATQGASEERRSAEDRALDRFADMMIDKISTISEDWKKPWFTEGAGIGWPRNLDGRDYNGMNALMLMMHCEKEGFRTPVFMTFDRVNGLNFTGGRKTGGKQVTDKEGNPLPPVSVNKDSRSFPVFLTTFTVVDPDTHEKVKYDDYRNMSEDEKSRFRVFPKLNVYNVFNIDQTNMAQARPELYQKLADGNGITQPRESGEEFSFPEVDAMISANRWLCPIHPEKQDGAFYSPSRDVITVPTKEQFVNGESFYGTLLHEMVHSTGSESRLNRLVKGSGFGSPEYAREELVAELGSALIAQKYGFAKQVKDESCAYLKNWLQNLRESPDFIKTTLQDVKKATGMIVDEVEKLSVELKNGQLEVQQEEAKPEESKEEQIAARDISKEKFGIYSAGVGRYVTFVKNPVVWFGERGEALEFSSRDAARAVARECRSYMPDERFTVRSLQETALERERQSRMDRLSDYGVELRGETKEPWLFGSVDGEPVLSVRLDRKEHLDFLAGKTNAGELALDKFSKYLDSEPQEKVSQGQTIR